MSDSPKIDCLNHHMEHRCNVGEIKLMMWQEPFDPGACETATRAAYLCEDCAVVFWGWEIK